MKFVGTAALLFVSLMSVAPVSADVIELRTGERVEGTFKGADDSAVRIEVDGRIVTFAPAHVRAIYYGSVPASTTPASLAEREEAIGALEGLRSVARTGVTYREYAPRVGDAQIVIDRYLKKEDGAPSIKGAIADSFHFYALAGTAWNAGLSRGNYAAVGTDSALARCSPAQRVIAESKRKSPFLWRAKGAGEGATTGMVIASDGIAALWSCAADKLAEAEKLR
jgi:hypothetical protein